MRKLFVVIVTFNGEKWIKKCISSIYNSTISTNVIIVDNGSTDNTISIIKNEYKNVELIISSSNLGFGKANNIAIKSALDRGADYIYLLNQDAWVEKNTFSLLIESMEKHPEYGIVSPIHLTGDGKNVDNNFYKISLSKHYVPNILNDYITNNVKDIYDSYFVMAAHWMLSRQTIEKIGYFSSAFPHYGEDANYIHRIYYWKLKVGIVPKAFAYHDREYRRDSPQKQVYREYINFLTRFHDIYGTSWLTRQKWILLIFIHIIKIKHVPIQYKIKMLTKAYSSIRESKIYRLKYKQKTYPYEQIKEFS
ncbi:MAG TPA: glycosyltransferase family 2 protein [Prevotellaceae bacterium]|nr:glycosyltransferase family 2 protein [Prevotellaceae bacterium]